MRFEQRDRREAPAEQLGEHSEVTEPEPASARRGRDGHGHRVHPDEQLPQRGVEAERLDGPYPLGPRLVAQERLEGVAQGFLVLG